jgi:hypothetical protein
MVGCRSLNREDWPNRGAAQDPENEPPFDLSAMSIARFGSEAQSEAWLRKDAAWQYRHFYGAV